MRLSLRARGDRHHAHLRLPASSYSLFSFTHRTKLCRFLPLRRLWLSPLVASSASIVCSAFVSAILLFSAFVSALHSALQCSALVSAASPPFARCVRLQHMYNIRTIINVLVTELFVVKSVQKQRAIQAF